MMSRNRTLFLFLALFLWKNADGLGVFLNRPANYWQSGGGSKSLGDEALYPVKQDFSSTDSGLQTAVYDVGSAWPWSTSGSGDSVANVPGFLWQYAISADQNVLNQYSPAPQSQGGYTAQSSVSSGGLSLQPQSTTNQAAPGFQSQLLSSPVSSAQSSAGQSLASQQGSLRLGSPGQGISSLPQSLTAGYAFGTQTQPSVPATVPLNVASDFPTTPQDIYGSQSLAGTLYGQPSSWYSFTLGQTPSQSVTAPSKPVSSPQDSASQSPASQQSSLSALSQVPASASQSFPSSYVSGVQAQSSSPVTSTLSVASSLPSTSQQTSSGAQLAAGTLYGQPSSWYSPIQSPSFQSASPDKPAPPSQGTVSSYSSILQTLSQFQNTPYKPVSQSQGPAGQSLASQQSSLQVTSPSQGAFSQPLSLSGSYVFGTQNQPSRPATVPLSVSPTTSQQASFVSQSTPGTLYGQPSSWYSFTQGQTPSQSVTAPYKPVSTIQDSASQSPASQQSSLSYPSMGSPVIGIQAQSSSPVTSTLSVASNLPTSQQASSGSQSATDVLYGQASSVQLSTKGQSVPIPSQSADAPNRPALTVMGTYTAGPAQWYRIDPFGRTSQTTVALSPSQASGSLATLTSSSLPSASQSQSTTGSFGFGIQSQTAPASTVALTQSAAQFPSFQTPSGFSSTSFSAASPSALVSQPSQGIQSSVTWSSPSLSTSLGQSTPDSFGFGFQSQSAPALAVSLTQGAPASALSLTQSAAQVPSLQTPDGFSSTSFSASIPSASLSQPIQGGQSSWESGVYTSFGPISSGQIAPVASTQQYSSDALPSTDFSGTFPSAVASTSQTSGTYGSTIPSSTTQLGTFDQYSSVSSPLSVASTSAQGTPTSFGFLQGYSSQPFVFKPAPWKGKDSSVKS